MEYNKEDHREAFETAKEEALAALQNPEFRRYHPHGDSGFEMEGDMLVFTRYDGKVSAWLADDLTTELSTEQMAAKREELAAMSLMDQFERGYPRPASVTVDQWKAVERDYFHQMTLENTPEEFIHGELAEDMQDPMSYYTNEQIEDMERQQEHDDRRMAVELLRSGETARVSNGEYNLEGDVLVFTDNHGSVSAWKTDDLNVQLSDDQLDAEMGFGPHWTDVTPREEIAREYRFRDHVVARLEAGEAEVVQPWSDGGQSVSRREGNMIVWQGSDGALGAYSVDDVTREFSAEQIAANRAAIAAEQSTAPVSDAELDAVFEQHADDHQRSIHGIDKERDAPALTDEQAKAIFADKETDDFQKTMQIVEEIENGFPSQDPLFSELHADMEIQRQLFGAPWSPSSSTPVRVSEIAKSADQSNVVSLKEVAASFREAGQVATPEKSKTAEQATDMFAGMNGMSEAQRQILGTDVSPSIPMDQGKPAVAAQTGAQPSAPSFMKTRGPDFSTPPKAKEQVAATPPKLTSESRIVRLVDRDDKPKLASDEMVKQGAGVSIERKAFTLGGKEIVASYEMTKGGNVVYTDYDGSKTEMSFERAKRHEIAHLAQLNANALIAINMMATDPKFTLRQGDATYSVQNGFFCQKLDDGSFKKEPLARTQERWMARGREIEAMMPAKSKATSELAASFRSVPTQTNNSKTMPVEQGMTP